MTITSSATIASLRPVADVAIPNSKLAQEITKLGRDTESALLFNHSGRALTGVRRGIRFDEVIPERRMQAKGLAGLRRVHGDPRHIAVHKGEAL
jgi:hypothetical protein